MKQILLRVRVIVRTSNMKISRRCFASKSVPHVQHDYFTLFNQSLIGGAVVAVAVVIREY